MDWIAARDWGAYSFFSHNAPRFRAEVQDFMRAGYFVGIYGAGALVILAVVLFFRQGKPRDAAYVAAGFVGGWALLRLFQRWLPGARPTDAHKFFGPEVPADTFPAAGVFLFMLAVILLGLAVWEGTSRGSLRWLYRLVAAPAVVWVSVSQLFLCVHFVTDVLGAMIAAVLVGLVVHLSRLRLSNC